MTKTIAVLFLVFVVVAITAALLTDHVLYRMMREYERLRDETATAPTKEH